MKILTRSRLKLKFRLFNNEKKNRFLLFADRFSQVLSCSLINRYISSFIPFSPICRCWRTSAHPFLLFAAKAHLNPLNITLNQRVKLKMGWFTNRWSAPLWGHCHVRSKLINTSLLFFVSVVCGCCYKHRWPCHTPVSPGQPLSSLFLKKKQTNTHTHDLTCVFLRKSAGYWPFN